MRDDLLPPEDHIFGWIEEVFGQGVRRPGYPADRWAEGWLQEQFRALGLEDVRAEPVEIWYWKDRNASLEVVTGGDTEIQVPCFPLPHSTPGEIEAQLVPFDADPGAVRDAVALCDVTLNRPPHKSLAGLAKWTYDPGESFGDTRHVLPFGREIMHVMEPAIAAGASAWIGVLTGYPGGGKDYYVPYDAVERPVPGVWISESSGAAVRRLLAEWPAVARLSIDAERKQIESYNIVGELPGADDEAVIIGSHHDGPWASAVEDGSGIAMVLAQAAYWSRVPQAERPHRLVFLLNAGHMAGGAGQRTFVETHGDLLERTVLEIHLEHAANEVVEREGELVATGQPEARWWFASDLKQLEGAVQGAIKAEDIRRSLIMRPTAFGPKPTTDGADFYVAGVPIVHYLAAPWYLFDSGDTLDKVHRPSLTQVTRATVRLIEWTAGRSAASVRADA